MKLYNLQMFGLTLSTAESLDRSSNTKTLCMLSMKIVLFKLK